MGEAGLDPRLLVPAGAVIPAEEIVSDLAGAAGVVRIEGDEASWSSIADLPLAGSEQVVNYLRRVPALTVALSPPAPSGSVLAVLQGCDLVTSDPEMARDWIRAVNRSPEALVAAALLARRGYDATWDGLVAESTTYSMLQSGPEFQAWRARSATQPADDPGPRVRHLRSGPLHEVVLCRVSRHNALDTRMRDELYAALDAVRREGAVVIVRADGASFCSGGDLGEFGTFPEPVSSHLIRLSRSLALCFSDLGPRMVVGLHGACLGAGIELPAFAAHVVAAEDTQVGLPEATMGLIPGAGGTVSVRRRAGARRMLELLIGGQPVDAPTALRWGLVDEVVPRERLEERLGEVAAEMIEARRGSRA